jgi:pyruvate/2-oxoglutarate dehydrogenase complex dihydrolipoamide acyltransferase (E2) component
VAPRAVVEDGVVVPRSTLIATLNVDHRVLDGADAARLLAAFAAAIGRPAALTGEDAAA